MTVKTNNNQNNKMARICDNDAKILAIFLSQFFIIAYLK